MTKYSRQHEDALRAYWCMLTGNLIYDEYRIPSGWYFCADSLIHILGNDRMCIQWTDTAREELESNEKYMAWRNSLSISDKEIPDLFII